VALEALKEAWVTRKLDLNLLAHYAQICRVQKVMQPYLEMLCYDQTGTEDTKKGIKLKYDIS
jgi:hypothetical protein